uniref:Uncharacterized protein n=1 Tax=Arundo donax TaxID=35708 RepID=A0A0A8XNH0_ARUDO
MAWRRPCEMGDAARALGTAPTARFFPQRRTPWTSPPPRWRFWVRGWFMAWRSWSGGVKAEVVEPDIGSSEEVARSSPWRPLTATRTSARSASGDVFSCIVLLCAVE